jgi:hypothetical protein
MNPPTLLSLADKEAEARKDSVLRRFAYLYDSAKGSLRPEEYPGVRPEILEIFAELVEAAAKYKKVTGRHLPILGELGELFAEIMFGLKRHEPMTQGSDGMLGNDFVEVKTITPDKKNDTVQVKRTGNFSKLVVVKISDDFQFAARMVDRAVLSKGKGGYATLSWDSMVANEKEQELHRNFPMKKAAPQKKPLRGGTRASSPEGGAVGFWPDGVSGSSSSIPSNPASTPPVNPSWPQPTILKYSISSSGSSGWPFGDCGNSSFICVFVPCYWLRSDAGLRASTNRCEANIPSDVATAIVGSSRTRTWRDGGQPGNSKT